MWFERRVDYLTIKEHILHQDSAHLLQGHEDADQFDRMY